MGILLAISASAFFSLSHLTVRQGVQKVGPTVGTGIMLVAGILTTTSMALALDGVLPLQTASGRGVLFFALAGVVHFLGGWGFMNAAASRIGATRVSAMTSVTPMFATLMAFLLLGQTVNLVILAGIALMTFGIYAITTSKE